MVTYGARGADAAGRKALGAATDYIFASGWWSDLLPYPQVKAFSAKWKAANGADPQWYHAAAYETVRVLLTALAKASSLKPDAIRSALAAVDLKDSILPGGELKFSVGTGDPSLRRDAEQAGRQGGHRLAARFEDWRCRRARAEKPVTEPFGLRSKVKVTDFDP
jgi:ABC-type branched-subunit amino acid transport system substrate-binding protein